MKATPLRQELRLAFALLATMLVLMGVAGVVAVIQVRNDLEDVSGRLVPAVRANEALLQAMTDAETGVRGYALSGLPLSLDPYESARTAVPRRLVELRQAVDDPALTALVDRQEAAIGSWFDRYAEPRLARGTGAASFDPALFALGKRLFDTIREENATLDNRLEQRLEEVRDHASATSLWLVVGLLILTVLAVATGIVTSTLASRRITGPLRDLGGVLAALSAGEHDARAEPRGPAETRTIAAAVNTLADESDRLRRIEREDRRLQAAVLDYARRVHDSLDPEAVLEAGVADLGRMLSVSRVYYRPVEGDHIGHMTHQWAAEGVQPLSDTARRMTPGNVALLREIYLGRRVLAVEDVWDSTLVHSEGGRHWARTTGARGSLTIPVAVHNTPVGLITCLALEPHGWTDNEIHASQAIASDLGQALEHAQLYRSQEEAIERLHQLDRAKDEFMSGISHELRTPMTSVSGYLELLEDDPETTPEQRRVLGIVRRNVTRLSQLIEDLLTLTRIESGAFRTTFDRIDLTGVVTESIEDVRTLADDHGLRITCTRPDRPVWMLGDANQLARALTNLLSNAVKFTPAGGRIDVRLDRLPTDAAVCIEVRDTGIGIPARDQDALFTRFFRAGNAVSSGIGGTGLGLTIVRTIAVNHGGQVQLDSTEGEGTAVRLVLPVDGRRDARSPSVEPVVSGRGP